jgi:hypothetical protein
MSESISRHTRRFAKRSIVRWRLQAVFVEKISEAHCRRILTLPLNLKFPKPTAVTVLLQKAGSKRRCTTAKPVWSI